MGGLRRHACAYVRHAATPQVAACVPRIQAALQRWGLTGAPLPPQGPVAWVARRQAPLRPPRRRISHVRQRQRRIHVECNKGASQEAPLCRLSQHST